MRPPAVQGGVFGFLGRHLIFAGVLLALAEFGIAGLVANTDTARNRALSSAAANLNVPPGWSRAAPTRLAASDSDSPQASWQARPPEGRTGPAAAADIRRWMTYYGYRLSRPDTCGTGTATCRVEARKGSYVLAVLLPGKGTPRSSVPEPVSITLRRPA